MIFSFPHSHKPHKNTFGPSSFFKETRVRRTIPRCVERMRSSKRRHRPSGKPGPEHVRASKLTPENSPEYPELFPFGHD